MFVTTCTVTVFYLSRVQSSTHTIPQEKYKKFRFFYNFLREFRDLRVKVEDKSRLMPLFNLKMHDIQASMFTCICMWMLFIVVKLWRTRHLHYSPTAESSLGKIAKKYCENFSQNLSFSPKFVKFATFFSNRLIFTNFGEKDKF